MKEVLIIKMYFKHGYTMREISTVTGMKIGEVRDIIYTEKAGQNEAMALESKLSLRPPKEPISVDTIKQSKRAYNIWKGYGYGPLKEVAFDMNIEVATVSVYLTRETKLRQFNSRKP